MAFIREYAEAGDPFRFRLPRAIRKLRFKGFAAHLKPPRALRKLRVGRALGSVAKFGAIGAGALFGGAGLLGGFARVLGPSLGRAFGALYHGASSPSEQDQLLEFARSYGYDLSGAASEEDAAAETGGEGPDVDEGDMMGDYMGDPGRPSHNKPPGHPRHKMASAGPGAKSAAARRKRSARHGGGTAASDARAAAMLAALKSGQGPAGALAAELAGFKGGKHAPGMHHHRRINPANVRALNRSLRRVEGFEKLARRVMHHKLFRRVRGHASGIFQRHERKPSKR